jgi:ubiquinone biosynthesis protein UbiJ
MNQLRRDPVTAERAARADLADAARRVRRELDAVVLDLAHFRRGTQQAAAESWTALREEMAETARALGEEMQAAARPMAEAAKTSAEDLAVLSDKVDSLASALDRLAGRLDAVPPGATVTPLRAEPGEPRRPVAVPDVRDGRP